MPFDSFAKLRGTGESKASTRNAGAEVLELEIDRFQPRRKIGLSPAIIERQETLSDLEGADAQRGYGLSIFWHRLRFFGRLRAQLRQIQATVFEYDGVYKGRSDIDVAEGVGAVPDGRHFEIDKQPSEPHELDVVRAREREILDFDLEQKWIDANLTDGRCDAGQYFWNFLHHIAAQQLGRQPKSRDRIDAKQQRHND